MEDVRRLPELTLESQVAVRSGVAARLETRGDTVFLFYSGRVLSFPARAADLLESILRDRRFAVGEIETHLGDQSRLMMARQLMKEGVLTVAAAAKPAEPPSGLLSRAGAPLSAPPEFRPQIRLGLEPAARLPGIPRPPGPARRAGPPDRGLQALADL